MEYVINPWWFYWLGVVDMVNVICVFAILLCVLGGSVAIAERNCKIVKRFVIAITACALMLVFVPSSDTLIKMAVAKNVTTDKVEAAQNVVAKVYDDIMKLIKEKK